MSWLICEGRTLVEVSQEMGNTVPIGVAIAFRVIAFWRCKEVMYAYKF